MAVPATDVKDRDYHAYRIGDFTRTPGLGFWIAPPANGETVEAMWVDRFFLVKGRGK
jgi:hypothetical protein